MVEPLLIIVIFGILVALLSPAILSAGQTACGMLCSSHMRHIEFALHDDKPQFIIPGKRSFGPMPGKAWNTMQRSWITEALLDAEEDRRSSEFASVDHCHDAVTFEFVSAEASLLEGSFVTEHPEFEQTVRVDFSDDTTSDDSNVIGARVLTNCLSVGFHSASIPLEELHGPANRNGHEGLNVS